MATTRRTPPIATGMSTTTVTPTGDGFNQRMTVEKGVVDELLLVCGVIGSTTTDPSNEDKLVPVTDCLNWLQDLQRALRRDDDTYRPISLLLGNWKVVQQKLLPLVMSCRYDTPMVLTIVKILVILTKPLSENAKRAGRMVIDTKNRKLPESVVKEQIKLRENALVQSEMLMEYKKSITHHSSHLTSRKSKEKKQGGLLSVFVSLLAEPLSKTGTARTDSDHLTIELVLHLFRNLLSADPILKSSSEVSQRSALLHQELVVLFEQELVLDIVLVIAQEMELRENAQYNLLMMELLHHLLRNQDPTAVARCVKIEATAKYSAGKENEQQGKTSTTASKATMKKGKGQAAARSVPKSFGSLRSQLDREKQKFSGIVTSRHSHFGGTLVVKRQDGKRQYRSAVLGDKCSEPPAAKKRKNRKTDPFIGAGKTFASHTRGNKTAGEGPTAIRAQRSLYNFCTRFVKDCYGPVMKSLKNEFRRDSVRLEEGDKVVFFRIVWFFCQWWRVSGAGRAVKDQSTAEEGESKNALGQMIFTMDVFTFNLVLNATDTFQQHKKHTQQAQTVALYGEMMHMLLAMYRSKDSTENIMALGLLNRLFYGNDTMDRLPKLLSKWMPGTSTREYLCDLVELCHVTLKLLELNAKACLDDPEKMDKKTEADKKKIDTVYRMREAAAEFDVSSYISRKIISNHLVFMYTHLLSQYLVNAPHVNHHLIAFFLRLCKMNIVVSEDQDADYLTDPALNMLTSKTVTLEPMLYHVQMFTVLEQILNDASIRNDKEYSTLLSFAASVTSKFANAAKKNPMLYVECLFRHPVPHRFCELSTNMYVNEELRMIAERELLLDERRRLENEADEEEGEDDGLVQSRGDDSRIRDAAKGEGRLGSDPRLSFAEDEEETEWVDDNGNVSETAAKATEVGSASYDDGSDEGEKQQAANDDSDSKWNDRRPFVPPRKLGWTAGATENDDSTPEGRLSPSESPANATSPSQKKRRIGQLVDDRSSEEDDDSASLERPVAEKKKKSRIRKVASDSASEDEDDDIFEKEETSKSASGATSSRKFVFDDDE